VIILIITIFLFSNVALAAKMKISAQQAEEIKKVLGITQTLLNISKLIVNDNDLATILNKAIGVGQTGTDATYGLLVLSALNEMDLMDLVLSQRYKEEARDYFNKVLKEKTDLLSYWKGVGFDIPKVVSGYITGPMAGLTLNSFAITDKAIAIFGEFYILETMKLYDGLWRYFDERRNGELHQGAWELAEPEMGFAALRGWSFSYKKPSDRNSYELEAKFLALWDKWGPYATPYGISKKYKDQLAGELRDTLVAAIQTQPLAKEAPQFSLIDKLYNQFIKLKEVATTLINQINPFKAGPIIDLSRESVEPGLANEGKVAAIESAPVDARNIKSAENSSPLVESLAEDSPSGSPEEIKEPEEILEPEPAPPIPITPKPVPEPASKPAPISGPILCERDSGNPTRFRVFIDEVAWMGTANSSNDEWIELKNIWGIPVKLNGWQLLDKDRQIEIIFGEGDIIPANGYYLLERTDDNSMPDAKADLIYTGALNNTDEALYLFDDQCNIEDEVLANPSWPAGDNTLKKPMARLDVLDWYSGVSTPRGENSSPPVIRSSASVPIPSPTPSSISPQIFITETYIGSEGSQKDDFVELYNPNSAAANLTGWYLQRKTSGAQDFSSYVPHELFVGKTIGAQDYFLIANASSSFATSADVVTTYPLTENNTLVLKNSQQEIIDQVSTDNPSLGKSYGRKWSSTTLSYTEDFEAQTPTPRAQNQNSAAEDGEEEEPLPVVINEVAWAGTQANHFDEWLELLVNSTTSFDGWKILGTKNGTTTIEIPLSGYASSSTYLLIERTDDNTISDILADFFFTGGLDNNGMKLELWDSEGALVDSVDGSSGWFAGSASPDYVSMERINPLAGSDPANWAGNNRVPWEGQQGKDAGGEWVNGTPKSKNSVAKELTTVIAGGFQIENDFTLALLGSPYLVEGSINVVAGAKLIIEPGVTIKFKHNNSWKSELKVEGELMAIGTEVQRIIFTSSSTQPAAGDWEWLYFKNAQAILNNVVIQYAGKKEGNPPFSPPFTRGAVYIEGGNVQIKNSTIENNQTIGVWLKDSADSLIDNVVFADIQGDWEKPAAILIENSSPIIKNSTFQNNNVGIWIDSSASSTIENNVFESNQTPIKTNTLLATFSGNIAQNNNLNGILVSSFGFSDTINQVDWQKANLPYIFESYAIIFPGQTLNIKPGVVIKLKSNGRIYVDGTLRAEGSENEKITFTSLEQASPGAWGFISFSASSINSILDNVIVRYGGWYSQPFKSGAVKINNTDVIISNSLFEDNLFAGLELENSTTTIINTVFKDHRAKYNYDMENSKGVFINNATPIFTNAIFNNNYYGVYVEPGECPDLTEVSFGAGDEANSVDVWPESCLF